MHPQYQSQLNPVSVFEESQPSTHRLYWLPFNIFPTPTMIGKSYFLALACAYRVAEFVTPKYVSLSWDYFWLVIFKKWHTWRKEAQKTKKEKEIADLGDAVKTK